MFYLTTKSQVFYVKFAVQIVSCTDMYNLQRFIINFLDAYTLDKYFINILI